MNTAGNEDSRLCSLATSHNASLPLNFAMSFMFLKIAVALWLAKWIMKMKYQEDKAFQITILTVQDHQKKAFFQ